MTELWFCPNKPAPWWSLSRKGALLQWAQFRGGKGQSSPRSKKPLQVTVLWPFILQIPFSFLILPVTVTPPPPMNLEHVVLSSRTAADWVPHLEVLNIRIIPNFCCPGPIMTHDGSWGWSPGTSILWSSHLHPRLSWQCFTAWCSQGTTPCLLDHPRDENCHAGRGQCP